MQKSFYELLLVDFFSTILFVHKNTFKKQETG